MVNSDTTPRFRLRQIPLQFFFFDNDPEEDAREGRGGESGGMAMLMRAMEREEYDEGILLMEQVRKRRVLA